mmetsp:Transcript_38787/g.68172  ORF Transcript_38787/g.68172 Transcript_38787/m.68172 type:complete len:204 (+) Transcript_38787:258-869(+)
MSCTLSTVVSLSVCSAAGRQPLSTSSSHSWPSSPACSTSGASLGEARAARVPRHARCCPNLCPSTTSGSMRCAFTANIVPLSAFSGIAPRGLIGRESRKVPVHAPSLGSSLVELCDSLYTTRVRGGSSGDTSDASKAERSKRIAQYASFADQKLRCTPRSRAASTASRCSYDQYSSCPTDRYARDLPSSSAARAGTPMSAPAA